MGSLFWHLITSVNLIQVSGMLTIRTRILQSGDMMSMNRQLLDYRLTDSTHCACLHPVVMALFFGLI